MKASSSGCGAYLGRRHLDGAINASLIVGNPPERRVERLREFWQRVHETLRLAGMVD